MRNEIKSLSVHYIGEIKNLNKMKIMITLNI